MKKFLTILLVLNSIICIGQVTATFDVTESTCENNGTITANASGGIAPYSYTLSAGPAGSPVPQTIVDPNNIFASLMPGTYTIVVADNLGEEFTGNATIVGNYVAPSLSLSGTDVTCNGGNDGTITASMSDGLPAYSYEILSPINVGPQTSPTFNGLTAGTYEVRGYDQCGNFQTRFYTLIEPTSVVDLLRAGIVHVVSCDTVEISVGAINGVPPYTFQSISPDTIQPINQWSGGAAFHVLETVSPWVIEVTDACGNTDTYVHTIPSKRLMFSRLESFCDSFQMDLSANDMLLAPYDYEIISGPTGPIDLPGDSTGLIPFGTYTYKVTDACGVERYLGKTVNPPEVVLIDPPSVTLNTCYDSTARIYLSRALNINVNEPWTYNLIDYPVTYSGDTSSLSPLWYLPLGSYQIEAADNCGNADTVVFEVTEVAIAQLKTAVMQGCVNGHSIDAQLCANDSTLFTFGVEYELYDASNGNFIASNFTGDFNNLSNGDYIVNGIKCSIEKSDTISVYPYEQPLLDPAVAIVCDDNRMTISTLTNGGTAPFTYELLDGSLNVLVGPQASPYFVDQPNASDYRVRVADACGNSSIRDAAIGNNLNLRITTSPGPTCEGDSLVITVDSVAGVDYSWTGPNGFTAIYRQLNFDSLKQSDEGLYEVTYVLQDSCVIETTSYNLNVLTPGECAALPVELLSFEATAISRNEVLLTWETASELDNDHFVLARSKDGNIWEAIDIVEGQGTTSAISRYATYDNNPYTGVSYYRLKQVDYNGNEQLSQSRQVIIDMDDAVFSKAYPNPTFDMINVDVNVEVLFEFDVKIFTLNSTKVYDAKQSTDNRIRINVEDYLPGIYFMQITNGNSRNYQKFTVMH